MHCIQKGLWPRLYNMKRILLIGSVGFSYNVHWFKITYKIVLELLIIIKDNSTNKKYKLFSFFIDN